MAPYVDILRTSVKTLVYDYAKRQGTLHMPAGCSCDMSGCAALFAVIDPDVRRIETYAGTNVDAVYVRESGHWAAFPHRVRS